jgi:tetratricopeptide (TPR) repeat protein
VWVEQKFCAENGEAFDFSLVERFLIAGRLFWFYLGELCWPDNLMLLYPAWRINQTDWWQYLFPVAALILFLGLWVVRKKTRGPFAAAVCFLLMLFPVLGFFNLSFFMSAVGGDHAAIFRADHFQYLATMAVIAPVSAGLAWFAARIEIPVRYLIHTGAAALVLILAILTRAQSATYRDAETCFRSVITKNPNSASAHSNLGNALMNKGSMDQAILEFERSIQVDPDYQFGHYNLGVALLEKGQTEQAIAELETLLKMNPNHWQACFTLGTALSAKGEPDPAIAAYERVIKIHPGFPDAYTNLANLLLKKGEMEGALANYRRVVQFQPNNPGAHFNLAVGLARHGDLDAAISELQTALQIDPNYPDAEPFLRKLLAR